MGSSQQRPQRADARDAYRNGFIDGMVYQRGANNPSEAQVAQAIDVLVGQGVHADMPKQKVAEIRLAGLNLLRQQLSKLA